MRGVEFNGETYQDDRMFVLHLCKCTVANLEDDVLETKIYHEKSPDKHYWCLVTYRNVPKYPAIRVDHFDSLEAARDYMQRVEPTVPLISLGGNSPKTPLPYDQFVEWKTKNQLNEYDYKKMYTEGDTNPIEVVLSKKR